VARTFDEHPKVFQPLSAEAGKPDRVDLPQDDSQQDDPIAEVDREFWEKALADAERAEKEWRARGREIIRIYRNDGYYTQAGKKALNKDIVFNVLFSNTEVMLTKRLLTTGFGGVA